MIIEIFQGSLEELKADILLIPHIQGASKDLYIKFSQYKEWGLDDSSGILRRSSEPTGEVIDISLPLERSEIESKCPKILVFFVGGSGGNLKDLPDALDKAFLRMEDFIFSPMAPVNSIGTIAPSLQTGMIIESTEILISRLLIWQDRLLEQKGKDLFKKLTRFILAAPSKWECNEIKTGIHNLINKLPWGKQVESRHFGEGLPAGKNLILYYALKFPDAESFSRGMDSSPLKKKLSYASKNLNDPEDDLLKEPQKIVKQEEKNQQAKANRFPLKVSRYIGLFIIIIILVSTFVFIGKTLYKKNTYSRITPDAQPAIIDHDNKPASILSNDSGKHQKILPPEPNHESASATRWAFIVGISNYKDPQLKLNYAARDAESFYHAIQKKECGTFDKDHIQLLIDKDANRDSLLKIRTFLKKPAQDDIVYLYFACHAMPDPERQNNIYLLPYDTNVKDISGTGIRMQEISSAIKENIISKKVMIFIDACHASSVEELSGLRGVSLLSAQSSTNNYLLNMNRSDPSIAIFTASESSEPSHEGSQWGAGHGVFTYYILDALDGRLAPRKNKECVTLGEMIDYVQENVKKQTDNLQHPAVGSSSFDRSIPVYCPSPESENK